MRGGPTENGKQRVQVAGKIQKRGDPGVEAGIQTQEFHAGAGDGQGDREHGRGRSDPESENHGDRPG